MLDKWINYQFGKKKVKWFSGFIRVICVVSICNTGNSLAYCVMLCCVILTHYKFVFVHAFQTHQT